MRSCTSRSSALTLRRYTETRDTNRYSIGEVLSNIKPPVPDSVDRRLGPPVDFSFCAAKKMSDFSRATPREGANPYIWVEIDPLQIPPPPPCEDDQIKMRSGDHHHQDDVKVYRKYVSNAIRLSNNSLVSFEGLPRMLEAVLDSSETLEWIDLSFNDLSTIDQVLLNYSNLKVLYLHANVVNDISQVDKLAALSKLKTLTLHGNIFDNHKTYRWYVIWRIPQLQFLDFSRVTNSDREKSKVFHEMKLFEDRSGGKIKDRKV